jgi:hypothetical protein
MRAREMRRSVVARRARQIIISDDELLECLAEGEEEGMMPIYPQFVPRVVRKMLFPGKAPKMQPWTM